MTYITENGGQWLVLPGRDSSKTNMGFNFQNFFLFLENWFWFILKLIFWILLALLAIFIAYLLIKCAIELYIARKKRSKIISRPRIFTPLPVNETAIDVERSSTPVVRFKKDEEVIDLDFKSSLNHTDEITDVFEGTSKDLNSRNIHGKKENFLRQANSFKRSFLSIFPTQSETSVNTLELTTMSGNNKKPFSKLNKKANI